VVLLLARPKDVGDEFSVAADTADLIIAKQRNGPVGDLKLNFRKEYTRFENYTE
jgi:replicative DNA helicase